MESLDDRILLSSVIPADLIDIEVPPSDSTPAQVVNSMFKGGFKITQDEFALFKAIGASSPIPVPYPNTGAKHSPSDIPIVKVLDKTTPLVLQLNDAVFDLGENLIKGKLTNEKILSAKFKIEYLEFKMKEVFTSSYKEDDQGKILSFLDAVKIDVGLLADKILSDTITSSLSDDIYFKLIDDAKKADELTLAAELDFVKGKTPGLIPNDFKVKIQELLNKDAELITGLSDADAQKLLLPAVQDLADATSSLLGSLGGGGDFDGGLTLTHLVDDIIT